MCISCFKILIIYNENINYIVFYNVEVIMDVLYYVQFKIVNKENL